MPDGTIVTFTETYPGGEATVDDPLKHGVAQIQMPTHNGAKISVASGVVMGNEIHCKMSYEKITPVGLYLLFRAVGFSG